MARYVDAIDLDLTPAEAFDYLADFSSTAEWDPGVASAERLDAGPLGVGSRFRVVVAFLARSLEFEYEILEYDRPRRLLLRGTHEGVVSTDEILFAERRGGTRVTYEARLELTGLLRFADPLLHVLFQHVGRLAVRGLRERTQRGAGRRRPRARRSVPAQGGV